MLSKDMVKVFTTLVQPLVEYSSQVWHSNLTGEQSVIIESIQDSTLRMIYPSMSYEEALQWCNIPTLSARRKAACKKLFIQMCDEKHKLHCLLRDERPGKYNTRSGQIYPTPICGYIDLKTHL